MVGLGVFLSLAFLLNQTAASVRPKYELSEPVTQAAETELPFILTEQKGTEEKSGNLKSTCVDYTMEGYYKSKVHYSGAPPSGFVRKPSGISACQLAQLHNDCVDRINQYRDGTLKFSDGTSDSNVVAGLAQLAERTGSNECSSEAAMGDLIDNYAGGGGCAGAHNNAFVCPGSGSKAQNSCCGRGAGSFGTFDTTVYDSYDKVKQELFDCLQSMWDEGITAGQKGHWQTMRSTVYSRVSCGFAWSQQGRVMMTQDFYTSDAACSPHCDSCGGSDGCSGNKCCGTEQEKKDGSGSDGLSGGAVAGIVIVVLAVCGSAIFALWWFRAKLPGYNRAPVRTKVAVSNSRTTAAKPPPPQPPRQQQGGIASLKTKFGG